jgi:phage gpG-like protein
MIVARFENSQFTATVQELERKCVNLTSPLSSCGQVLLSSIDKNFVAQGRFAAAGEVHGGTNRWQPLSRATILNRIGGSSAFRQNGALRKSAMRKVTSIKILQQSGRLAASFTYTVSGNTLTVGSNVIYAAIHNYGGPTGRGHKVAMPARPMLVVQDEDVDEMIEILSRYLFS